MQFLSLQMQKYILLIATVLCLLPTLTISQEIKWQNTIGGSEFDELNSIRQTIDGGYILGGHSGSDISGDKTEDHIGNVDYWILKTDSYGIVQWQNTIGGSNYDNLMTISQTTDGGYILGGYSGSGISGDKTEDTIGNWDMWIIKVDALGNIQWQNTIGGNGTDRLGAIEQTSDGGYILGGDSNSNISGDKTENSKGLEDYWIIKVDSLGVIQWQKTIGGNSPDYFFSLDKTDDGGFILGGQSSSNISGDKTENCKGSEDYWIIKVDSLGVIQWQNTIGGSGSDILYSLLQTVDKGYLLGGYSTSHISSDKTENCIGSFDFWIVKVDSLGTLLWENTIGGNGIDYLRGVFQTTDEGYILGGFTGSGISGDKVEMHYSYYTYYDWWIIKTDSLGKIQWQNTIAGSQNDVLNSIMQTTDGDYILGGYSRSDISFDKTENSNGFNDYWIIKVMGRMNHISGKVFIDINGNGIQDAYEPPVKYKVIMESGTARIGFSGPTGLYYVSVPDSGNFWVAPSSLNYYNAVPVQHSAQFTSINQIDSLNDFAFQPAGVFNDLCVTITPLGPFRAGFNANYQIIYENVGTTTLTPTVIFFPDDVSFVSAYPAANIITIDSVVWNFGPLAPFQTGSIMVTVNVTTGTPIGTMINSGAIIEPIISDASTGCNYSFWEVLTTGSYDPNDIIVDNDTLLSTQFPSPNYLEYLIRFQNTGNDTAFNVKVLNPIDTLKLDLSTFEFVTSTHPVNLNWIPWEGNMQFRFDNILLPDSNINEPASHGFIRYRIKPKSTLGAGDSISNYAAIYFDFNAPVITNTAVTRIMLATSLHESLSIYDQLLLYPNPANSTLNIETGNVLAINSFLIISDVAGRTILSKTILSTSSKHTVDISTLSQGIYFVQLVADERLSRGKFVKD